MWKKRFVIASLLFIGLLANGQTKQEQKRQEALKADTTVFSTENYIAKTGYNIAPLPEFQYDPFIGLYLGVAATIFDYGDGKRYPNYYRSLNINAAYGTKGKTNFSLKYLSYGDVLVSAYAGYSRTNLTPFYGYNGYQTLYNVDYHTKDSEDYITKPFYNFDQAEFRANAFVQDTLKGTFINWQVGFDVRNYKTDRVDFAKMNDGVNEDDQIPDEPTLFDKYNEWGIIGEDEKDGGWANALTAALIYDTRDRLTNPMNGMMSDVTLRFSPSFLGNTTSNLQLSLIHRHYLTLIPERVSFAYRLRYDASFGDIPFYARNILADGVVGFGGTGSLWGIHQNRVIANQFAMGNFELRAKLFRFRMIKQNWYIAAVPIFHTGYMIDEVDMDLSQVSDEDRAMYFNEDYGKWYSSYGLGAKIVMNENVAIGIDWAHSINKEAGSNAIYIGMGYSF